MQLSASDEFERHCWADVIEPAVLGQYRAYQRELRLPARPALLLIDLYDVAFRGGPAPLEQLADLFPSCGEFAWRAIEPIQRLIAAARDSDLPLIYTTQTAILGSRGGIAPVKRDHVGDPAVDFRIRDEFAPGSDDVVIYKDRASAFFGTSLASVLTENHVDGVIICGESTSGCVRASAVDAFSHGFHAVVVEECVFDRSPLSHKLSLFDLHHKYADVMHLDQVLSGLD